MSVLLNPLRNVAFEEVPQLGPEGLVRIFEPRNVDPAFYDERVDRNLGWVTEKEQRELLRPAVIGIAGCGGMGGLLASSFVRAGVGEVRIADCETFDVSNINRQFGALRYTVGESKALTTAVLTRMVSDDSRLAVYEDGITEQTVDHFLQGCDIVCDEIELLAVDARILLHQRARRAGISLFNCNTVGFSTNLFLYTPDGLPIEDWIGFDYETAKDLRRAAAEGDEAAATLIATAMVRAVIPEMPEYGSFGEETDREAFFRRLYGERKAAIIASNPNMAAGFLADRVLLHLLAASEVTRDIVQVPPMPGYLFFDAARMRAVVETDWRRP